MGMRTLKISSILTITFLALGISEANAKNTIGASCLRLNATISINGTRAICTKSGSKLIWKAQKAESTKNTKALDSNSPEYQRLLKEAIANYEANLHIPSELIKSDPSLTALLNQAIGYIDFSTRKFVNPMGLDEFSNRFNRTDYSQSLPPAYRLAELIRFEYPCDYINAYNQAILVLKNYVSDSQVPVSAFGSVQTCGNSVPNFVTGKEESLADWLLHGDTGFFYAYAKNVVMNQFQEHPWMFLQASSTNYGTATRTLSDLNWYFEGTDTASFTNTRAWDAVAVWKKNHGLS